MILALGSNCGNEARFEAAAGSKGGDADIWSISPRGEVHGPCPDPLADKRPHKANQGCIFLFYLTGDTAESIRQWLRRDVFFELGLLRAARFPLVHLNCFYREPELKAPKPTSKQMNHKATRFAKDVLIDSRDQREQN